MSESTEENKDKIILLVGSYIDGKTWENIFRYFMSDNDNITIIRNGNKTTLNIVTRMDIQRNPIIFIGYYNGNKYRIFVSYKNRDNGRAKLITSLILNIDNSTENINCSSIIIHQ